MHTRGSNIRAFLTLLLMVVLLSGCSAGVDLIEGSFTALGDISANPAAFEGKKVRVKGRVVVSGKMPFASTSFFTLVDEQGDELSVITEQGTPANEMQLWSYGVIENIAIVQGIGMGGHLKEQRRICQPNWGDWHTTQLLSCWLEE
ncbi:hypothetical protein [Candidatus Reidiella endopervernicosa]|nr:hypothetical protein [Candidatus Reidiella endopervernicosa]QKQ26281.1 hypothetical protein HUE57_08280 [Candidatus Reidiella endopervernicosa]